MTNEPESEKMMPCPFCGKTPEITSGLFQPSGRLYGLLCKCDVYFDCRKPSEAEAIATWNTRSDALLCGNGFVYHSPDSGWEYATDHPIESGECPDATDVRRSTEQEDFLHKEWLAAALMARAHPQADAPALATNYPNPEHAPWCIANSATKERGDPHGCNCPLNKPNYGDSSAPGEVGHLASGGYADERQPHLEGKPTAETLTSALALAQEALREIQAENDRAKREFTNVSNKKIADACNRGLSATPVSPAPAEKEAVEVSPTRKALIGMLDQFDCDCDTLAHLLDTWGGYCVPVVDDAISVMQGYGLDRWSMQAQMEAAASPSQAAEARVSVPTSPSYEHLADLAAEWGYTVEEAGHSYDSFLEIAAKHSAPQGASASPASVAVADEARIRADEAEACARMFAKFHWDAVLNEQIAAKIRSRIPAAEAARKESQP